MGSKKGAAKKENLNKDSIKALSSVWITRSPHCLTALLETLPPPPDIDEISLVHPRDWLTIDQHSTRFPGESLMRLNHLVVPNSKPALGVEFFHAILDLLTRNGVLVGNESERGRLREKAIDEGEFKCETRVETEF